MSWLKRYQKACISCDSLIEKDEKFGTIKYRYGDKDSDIGTAYMCEKCSDEMQVVEREEG